MNNLQHFATGLFIVSALVGLITEAIKKIMAEHNKTYSANTLAGIVALVLSSAVGVAYVFYTGAVFTVPVVLDIVVFVIGSWLCAMLGYDKVVQTLSQIKKEDN